jgi:hypothetical protein
VDSVREKTGSIFDTESSDDYAKKYVDSIKQENEYYIRILREPTLYTGPGDIYG